MSNKYKRRFKTKNKILFKMLLVPCIILVLYLAIRVGIAGGNMIFSMDSDFVKTVDTENFKVTLTKSFPLMDTVYNSGNINVTFLGEISNMVKSIFGFDLNSPVTILNAQSSLFHNYYKKDYQLFLAQQDKENNTNNNVVEDNTERDESSAPPKAEVTPPDSGNTVVDEGGAKYKEDASSITYEEVDENRDFSEDKAITSGNITLQNETKFKIDKAEIDRLLKEPLKLKFDKKGPKVLIYHTHTTESYIRNLNELEKKGIPNSSNDARYNVVRVGDEIAQNLEKKYGIDVIHNGTIHNIPYNSSYANSLSTIDKYLKSYPSIRIILDIHRDGLGSSGKKLRVVDNIKGKNAAKIMFVVGTNGTGLKNPNWKENLKLAIKLEAKLNEQYPGLAKPIYISNNRYNQHMAGGALIIEVGGDGNTLDEAVESAKYLAKAISDVIK